MQPLHMVSPASEDHRRIKDFPNELIKFLRKLIEKNITPRDIVTKDSIKNALIVSMALHVGLLPPNVMLHAPEISDARTGF